MSFGFRERLWLKITGRGLYRKTQDALFWLLHQHTGVHPQPHTQTNKYLNKQTKNPHKGGLFYYGQGIDFKFFPGVSQLFRDHLHFSGGWSNSVGCVMEDAKKVFENNGTPGLGFSAPYPSPPLCCPQLPTGTVVHYKMSVAALASPMSNCPHTLPSIPGNQSHALGNQEIILSQSALSSAVRTLTPTGTR